MALQIRRVVTGHDASGRAVVKIDEVAKNLLSSRPGATAWVVCAVPAASVIVENVVAFEVARALVEKFGNDSLAEMQARYELFMKMAKER